MKSEKIIKGTILLISLLGLVYFVSGLDFGRSDRFENLMITTEEYNAIIQERTEDELTTHPDIFFDDFSLTYDNLSNTYLYSVIEDSASHYDPLVRTVSTQFNRYDIAVHGDILNDESIRNNETAELILYTDDTYKQFNLSTTTLPIVTINMNEQLEDRDNPIGALDKTAQFTLFDNRPDILPSDRHISSQTYVRLRGASSLRFPKNQFRLNMREFSIGGSESNNHLSLLGMREDDDWILYSPYNDPEKMRNTLSNNLWYDFAASNNPLDVVNGTQGTFVEVFIDNKYWGIYTLMHPIDRKQLQLSTNNSDTSDFYYRAVTNLPFDLEDFLHYSEFNVRGRFELRDPDSNGSPTQWNPLIEHLTVLDEDEATLLDYIDTKADVDNLIDYYLFYILTQATDNNTKNRNYLAYYIEDDHFMLESPWDLDLTWGLRWTPEHARLSVVRGDPTENFSPSVSHITRLIEKENTLIKDLVRKRYDSLRSDQWSEEVFMSLIDDYEKMIYHSGAATRDYDRWPESAFAEDTTYFREFILNRLVSMDTYINTLSGGEQN